MIGKRLRDEVLSDRERKNLAILDLIRQQGPIAKTEISKVTGFNIVTVSNYVDEYITGGLVVEKGFDVSTGGRRPILVDLNPEASYVVGVGLTMLRVTAVVANLKGEVLTQVSAPRPAAGGESVIQVMTKMAEQAIRDSKKSNAEIASIGLGVPGIIDEHSRTIRWPYGLGTPDEFVNVALPEVFEQKFNLPAFVENDADAAVFGERWSTLRQDIQNMVYLYSGVGCGIILNGQIYHGSAGTAGELGILNPEETNPEALKRESTALGRWVMDLGMVAGAQERLKENLESAVAKAAGGDPKNVTMGAILEAVKEKDAFAVSLAEEGARKLGKKIAFLVNLLNPEIVVVGGGVEQAGPVFMDEVRKSVKGWALDEATAGLKILPSQLGEQAVAQGVACLGIWHIFANGALRTAEKAVGKE